MVSAAAIGAKGALSALAAIAPGRVRSLYDLCRQDRLFEARSVQEEIAALLQILKRAGTAGLKAALRAMGRDCGEVRPPLRTLGEEDFGRLSEALAAMPALRSEPRGW
jgi:dihydrodipicolinate synthase/N-acetylneuraminate lyase